MAISPTAEGFRATFLRPSLTLAEIMWRWTAGATAAALFLFGLFEYLDTLPVTNGELLFLRSRQPYLVGEAIAHILRGSLNRVVIAGLLAAALLAVLWMVAASVGRIAIVRGMLEYFRRDAVHSVSASGARNEGERDVAREVSTNSGYAKAPLPALLRLNFLRAGVAMAAVFGFVGASILAGFASPEANPSPWLAFFLFLPLAGLIGLVWWALNWLLSLAGMFAVRDGEDAMGAISAAASLCRERTGAVFAVTAWTVLAHLVAFVAATIAASMPMGFVAVVPWRLIFAGDMVVTLVYFAFADWLHTARLAGYVWIAEMPEPVLKVPLPPALPFMTGTSVQAAPMQTTLPQAGLPQTELPQTGSETSIEATIDRDETILSDVPNPTGET